MSNLIGNGCKERWYPNAIHQLKAHLQGYEIDTSEFSEVGKILSNISYNLQYIEYLRKTLLELNISGVIKIQTIKSFIVTNVSIIEAVFYLICLKENLRTPSKWTDYRIINKSEVQIENETYRIETSLFKKNEDGGFDNLTFDQMIKKIEKKKILNCNHQFFADLNHLRKLRNKIHLQELGEIKGKTDFNSFWIHEFNLAKACTRQVLTDDIFKGKNFNEKLFDFLIIKEKINGA